jgi:hypothetical protein
MDNSRVRSHCARPDDEADEARDDHLGTCLHHEDATDMLAFTIAMGL